MERQFKAMFIKIMLSTESPTNKNPSFLPQAVCIIYFHNPNQVCFCALFLSILAQSLALSNSIASSNPQPAGTAADNKDGGKGDQDTRVQVAVVNAKTLQVRNYLSICDSKRRKMLSL